MPRGEASKLGTVTITANGYSTTKTLRGWVPTQQLIAEKALGRALRPDERVTFADGDRKNLNPDNIVVVPRNRMSKAAKATKLEAQIAELQAQLKLLLEED